MDVERWLLSLYAQPPPLLKQIRKIPGEDLSLPPGGFFVHTLHGLGNQHCATRHPDLSAAAGRVINHAKPKSLINPYLRRAVDRHPSTGLFPPPEGHHLTGKKQSGCVANGSAYRSAPAWLLVRIRQLLGFVASSLQVKQLDEYNFKRSRLPDDTIKT